VQTCEAGSAAPSAWPAELWAGCRPGRRGLFLHPLGLKTRMAGSTDSAEKKNTNKI